MIYLFSGEDAKNKRLSYEKFVKSISKNAEKFLINRNNFNREQIESLCSGASLFSQKCVVLLENIFEQEETSDFILGKLKLMGKSGNDFIFLEGKLNKQIIDAFKKIEPKKLQINIFELPKEKKEKFNNFLISCAFE